MATKIIFTLTLLITSFLIMDNLATIESRLDLPNVSSGSGMAIVEDKIFIVGDDSPYLYELNREFVLIQKHLLLEGLPTEGRIPKSVKPDFECMAEEKTDGGTILWMFGSGSKSPERDQLIIYDPGAPERMMQYTLTDFYIRIMELWGIEREQLNLEAAVILDHQLYLFNRGSNQLAIVPLNHFKSYLKDSHASTLPGLKIKTLGLHLALIGQMQARFSGACLLPDSSGILFSATLEDTDNWIDDGEIHGTMVGFLDIQHSESFAKPNMSLIKTTDGKTALEKIESISFLELDQEGNMRLLAVTDNDDGASALFTLLLNRKLVEKSR